MPRVDLADEVRGDTISYNLTLSRPSAPAGWMRDGKIWFTAKLSPSDPDSAAVLAGSIDDGGIVWVDDQATQPTATLALGPAAYSDVLMGHTGAVDLVYDVQIRDAAGRVETPQWGRLRILPDIRRSS